MIRLAHRRSGPFVEHHAAQAAILWLLLDAIVFLSLIYLAVTSAMIVYARDMYERLPSVWGLAPPQRDSLPINAAALLWLVAVCIAAAIAAIGSTASLPLVGRLMRRPRMLGLAWIANILSLLFITAIAIATFHASTFTRDDERPAVIYVLYDDLGGIPRWIMNLGFYRFSTATAERWGPGSVIVGRLDAQHLRSALKHGTIVFLACHGANGDILTDGLTVIPASAAPRWFDGQPQRGALVIPHRGHDEDLDWLEPGENLRFVYNAACDSGRKRGAWQSSFAPAEVRTFDRLSLVAEHFQWAWFTAPRLIRGGAWPTR